MILIVLGLMISESQANPGVSNKILFERLEKSTLSDSINYRQQADEFFKDSLFHAASALYKQALTENPTDTYLKSRQEQCQKRIFRDHHEVSPLSNYKTIVEQAFLLFELRLYDSAYEFFEWSSEYFNEGQAYLEGLQECEKFFADEASSNVHNSRAFKTKLYDDLARDLLAYEARSNEIMEIRKRYSNGTVHCDVANPTSINEIVSPSTGKIWMDRNLGAKKAAENRNDYDAYGDLYQWGRGADGHQCRQSLTTTEISSTDQPNHVFFIQVTEGSWHDWREGIPKKVTTTYTEFRHNHNLWKGVNGINNPCPIGYRLPSNREWENEIKAWTKPNNEFAFESFLKLPSAGFRDYSSGIVRTNDTGSYWAHSDGFNSSFHHLSIEKFSAKMRSGARAYGRSVRCIKN